MTFDNFDRFTFAFQPWQSRFVDAFMNRSFARSKGFEMVSRGPHS